MVTAARGHALMHRAQARYGYGSGIHGNGIIIGYCDGPEYIIRRDDGTQFHWRCDLTVVGDEVDPANLPEPREVPPGWVSAQRLTEAEATADRLRVALHRIHDLWREWMYGENSASAVEPGIAYCADRLGNALGDYHADEERRTPAPPRSPWPPGR